MYGDKDEAFYLKVCSSLNNQFSINKSVEKK
jgi:hypothetical protein